MSGSQTEGDVSPNWSGSVNGILYAVQFDPLLDDLVLEEVASLIVSGQVLTKGVAEYSRSIRSALAQGDTLNDQIGTPPQ